MEVQINPISARASILFTHALILQLALCFACDHDMPNQSGSAGCVCFGTNDHNQCSDLDCPEVHVETSANPCVMRTEAFSVPKTCCRSQNCNAPCCSAPYCSIPAPQPMCGTASVYASNCYPAPGNRGPRPPPPPHRPVQAMTPGCGCPYQYPPQMAPAPSYCVQSVVVGGKADPKKDDDNGRSDEEGRGRGTPEESVGRGNDRPGNETGTDRGYDFGSPRAGRGPGGLYFDPLDVGVGRAGIPGLLASGLRLPFPGLDRDDDPSRRYENYLERILDVIRDRAEPESLGPSPIMVMQDCSPRVKVRKIRRRRKQRKYMVESCEAPDDEIVEEEEESPCPCVIAAPCSRSYRERRSRRSRQFF